MGLCPTIAPLFLDHLPTRRPAGDEAYSGDLRSLMQAGRLTSP